MGEVPENWGQAQVSGFLETMEQEAGFLEIMKR